MKSALQLLISALLLTAQQLPAAAAEESLSTRISEAAKLARDGDYSKAETQYRELLTDVQLQQGFGGRDVAPILDGFAPVLRKLNKTQEADAAEALAKQITAGSVPLSTNAEAYLRADKTLVIIKRVSPNPAKQEGFAYVELPPDNEAYAPTIAFAGGLEPGHAKLLPPTLELPEEAMGLADNSGPAGAKLGVHQFFWLPYRVNGERKLVKLENKKMVATILFDTVAITDLFGNESAKPEYLRRFRECVLAMPVQDRVKLALFLNGAAGAHDLYPWMMLPSSSEMTGEDMQLLGKSFKPLTDWHSAELEKQRIKREAEAKEKGQGQSEQKPQENAK